VPCIREKLSADLADKAEPSDRASEAGELDHNRLRADAVNIHMVSIRDLWKYAINPYSTNAKQSPQCLQYFTQFLPLQAGEHQLGLSHALARPDADRAEAARQGRFYPRCGVFHHHAHGGG
jgi:hypothetical protein